MKIVILAGGVGTRLWPASREAFPKQFLKLKDQDSFLQKTIKRFLPEWSVEDLWIVTHSDYLYLVQNQLAAIDPKLLNQILLEPERKNTGPAIAWALQSFLEEEIVLISSSDHWIEPKDRFLDALQWAKKTAQKGKIVTFGIRPSRPETGYGYIEVEKSDCKVASVISFKEKPDARLAQEYVLSGNYFWNSGMFVFSVKTFWEEISAHFPALGQENFEDMPVISIDYALMEKSKQISMIPLEVSWSDIGSWDGVFELLDKDSNQNVRIGNVVAIDTKNSMIMGDKRLVVVVGLDDALVIETPDVLYVGKKEESQRIKAVVEELKQLNKSEAKEHPSAHRPWGYYTVLEEGSRYKVKKIVVNPEQKLSLQMHHHRSEHWIVIKGTALATIGDSKHLIQENESIYVPKSTVHRLENPGQDSLELIEVQVGEYVGEDDIIRFEDIYGRLKPLEPSCDVIS